MSQRSSKVIIDNVSFVVCQGKWPFYVSFFKRFKLVLFYIFIQVNKSLEK